MNMKSVLANHSRRLRSGRHMRVALRSLLAAALAAAGVNAEQAFAIINNTAQVSGSTPSGGSVSSPPASETVTTVPANPSLSVTKTGTLNDDDGRPGLTAGDTISYSVEVDNTGNVGLSAVSISDALVSLTLQSGDVANAGILDVTETWTYTGTYTITQADLDGNGGGTGLISNSASVTANGPGTSGTASGSDSFDVAIVQNPSLAIVKSASITTDLGQPGRADFGDVITYSYAVTNDGNVTISGVSISDAHGGSDPLPTPAGEAITGDVSPSNDSTDVTGNDGTWSSLAPGDTVTFTTTYTVTQIDVDNQ
ncbi:MAG: hypothetical protein KDJ48_08950 [Nitratireductor sp.]|nr:hypothetical protein [Nitratireductor sp.]